MNRPSSLASFTSARRVLDRAVRLVAALAVLATATACPPQPPTPPAPAAITPGPPPAAVTPRPEPLAVKEEHLKMGRFGLGTYLQPAHMNGTIVLVLSGLDGFRGEAGVIARALAERGALVAELDLTTYLQRMKTGAQDECSWPTIDFQTVTKHMGKGAGLPHFVAPVLVGYREGASLALTTAAQAQPDMFRGVVTVGFCPDLDLPRPPCAGTVGLGWQPASAHRMGRITPPSQMPVPWVALEDRARPLCGSTDAETFVSKTPGATIEWLAANAATGSALTASVVADVEKLMPAAPAPPTAPPTGADRIAELPLTEMPATGGSSDTVAVFVSGDGGWASLDEQLSEYLNEHGVPVVGLSSVRYFWDKHEPDGVAHDLELISRHYLEKWGKQRLLWIGYSAGADVLGYVSARMPADLLAKTRAVALVGPETNVEFEFHVTDWIPTTRHNVTGLPILPELMKLRGPRVLCVEGEDEAASLCPQIPADHATIVSFPGGHHFGGDYHAIGKAILDATPK